MENKSPNSPKQLLHFTYVEPEGSDLRQGDVLEVKEELQKHIQDKHHQHVDCTHVVVLTQCCDLIRRKEKGAKAEHISLAPVVDAKIVVDKKLLSEQSGFARKANVCSNRRKPRIKEFLVQLLNNNNSEYFYLHKQENRGFFNESCVSLREAFCLDCCSAYDACLNARVFSLKEPWRAKLGWLVGNVYDRVGTPDWKDEVPTDAFEKVIADFLAAACKWVDADKLNLAQKTHKHIQAKDGDELRELIERVEVESKVEKVLSHVQEALSQAQISQDLTEHLISTLRTNVAFENEVSRSS